MDAVQVPGRKVDAHLDRHVVGPPARRSAQRHVEHLLGQLADQVRLLGEPDELGRCQHARAGMLPAGKRLHADGLQVGQPDLWLVVQVDFAPHDGRPQVAGEREPLGRVTVGVRRVALDAAVPLLGQVHGDVGALHQLIERARVIGVDRDPDAGLHLERHGLQAHWFGERGPQPRGDLAGRGRFLDRGQQHRELVAAEAGDHVAWPDAVLEPVRHDLQQPVADGVAERVVDLLEAGRPVQVDQQESGLGTRRPRRWPAPRRRAWRAACG